MKSSPNSEISSAHLKSFTGNFCISINRVAYSRLIPFSMINNISISVNRSNFTFSFFFKLLVILILDRKENKQDQAHIFQGTYSKSSQIHQLTIMYHFEYINKNKSPIILILKSLQTLFACRPSASVICSIFERL